MTIKLHVLASGSKGNASIIENSNTGRALLIDCGICKRAFFERCTAVGFDPGKLEAVLVTHEHIDHTRGLGVVLRGLAKQGVRPSLYASAAVRQASDEILCLQDAFDQQCFNKKDELELAGLRVFPFRTSHDAAESFGFRIEDTNGDALGYMTDTGVVSGEALVYLRECRVLALESNHDSVMLQNGPYPYMLKKRIASDKGHLSNAQAAGALEALLSTKLEMVVAMHISENNNTYQIPRDTLSEVIARNTHSAQAYSSFQYRALSAL